MLSFNLKNGIRHSFKARISLNLTRKKSYNVKNLYVFVQFTQIKRNDRHKLVIRIMIFFLSRSNKKTFCWQMLQQTWLWFYCVISSKIEWQKKCPSLEAYLEHGRTSTMKPFCENRESLKMLTIFTKKLHRRCSIGF